MGKPHNMDLRERGVIVERRKSPREPSTLSIEPPPSLATVQS
jgi:hypothetical protein